MAEFEISAVITSHNPRPHFLPRNLEALQQQSLPQEKWELLLVDSACRSPLKDQVDLSWHQHGRHLRLDEPGVALARAEAIRNTSGKIVVFIDHDNVLDAKYLEYVIEIGAEYPFVGAWGGQIEGEFEVQPPDYMVPFLSSLALSKFDNVLWSNVTSNLVTTPPGAGLAVRRKVADQYARNVDEQPLRKMLDRRGTSLMSAGDTDLAFTACDLGLGTGIFPQLRMRHLIPKERLKENYLIKLYEGFGYSEIYLRALRGEPVAQRNFVQRTVDYLRVMFFRRFYRKLQMALVKGRHRALADLAKNSAPELGF